MNSRKIFIYSLIFCLTLFVIMGIIIYRKLLNRVFPLYFEPFQQYYKSQLVQLKKETSHPLTIAAGNPNQNTYVSRLIKSYSQYFPLIAYNNDGYLYDNLDHINKELCDLTITNLELANASYKGYDPYNNKNKVIRLICNLNSQSIILLAHTSFIELGINTWLDLKDYINGDESENKIKIAVDSSDKGNYNLFMKIMHLYEFNINKIEIINREIFDSQTNTDVVNRFMNNDISFLFLVTMHPDENITNLYSQYPCHFIDMGNMKLDNIHVKSPFITKESINLMDYNVIPEQRKMLDVLSIPLCLITRESINQQSIYRFIKGFFENIENLRNSYNEYDEYVSEQKDKLESGAIYEQNFYSTSNYKYSSIYKQQLATLTPSALYNIRSLIPLHNGSKQYFKEIGIITNHGDMFCANFLPDGNPLNVNTYENCNNSSILLERHHGHGHYG